MGGFRLSILLALLFTSQVQADEDKQQPRPEALTGVGIGLTQTGTGFQIFLLVPNAPAALSEEIQKGDLIIAVSQDNNEPVAVDGMSMADVVDLIRGPVGTEVRLTIIPANDRFVKQKIVSLSREKLQGGRLVGQEVPQARLLPLSKSNSWDIRDHRGQVVVLEFWASWCVPCMEHVRKMQTYPDAHPQWGDNVALVAVSVDDDRETAKNFVSAQGWDETINLWCGEDAKKEFDAHILPMTVIVDQQGKVITASSPRAMDVPRIVNRLLRAEREQAGSDVPPGVQAPKPPARGPVAR